MLRDGSSDGWRALLQCAAALTILGMVSSPALAESECFPACREGFVCMGGQCVSACNPPCDPGSQCVTGGRCAPAQGVTPPGGGGTPAPGPTPTPAVTPPPGPAPANGYGPPPAPTSTPLYVVEHPPQPGMPGAPPLVRDASADSTVTLSANVLGLLQFGPVLALEFGKRVSVAPRLRIINLGMLSYVIGFDEDSYLESGVGVGVVARWYAGEAGNMRGFYLGGGAELIYESWVEEDWFAGTEQSFEDLYFAPQVEIGYRWAFGSFLMGVGGLVGYAIVVDGPSDDVAVVMASLELGWFL